MGGRRRGQMDCSLLSERKPHGPWVGLFGSAGENVHQLQHISCFPVLAFLRQRYSINIKGTCVGVYGMLANDVLMT